MLLECPDCGSPQPLRRAPVSEALDEAIAAAEHLTARDAATVAAARALAEKIDAWDVIVRWAREDAGEDGGRPLVPANDNVSLASFLKYMESLRLVPEAAPKAKPGPASTASPAQQAIQQMREGLRVVT